MRRVSRRWDRCWSGLRGLHGGLDLVDAGRSVDVKGEEDVAPARMHVRRPAARLVEGTAVHLYLFDLLYHGQDSLLGLPYTQRRARLQDLGLDTDPVRTPWVPRRRGGRRGRQPQARPEGGVVGKPLASLYHAGQRRDWIKIKNVRHQEAIICGWQPGQGSRASTIGSLILGVYDDGRLGYAGNVGTGFTGAMLAGLQRQLVPLHRETTLRHACAAPVCPRRALGRTPPRRRGGVHRMDRRQEHASPELAGRSAPTRTLVMYTAKPEHPGWLTRALRPHAPPADRASASTSVRCGSSTFATAPTCGSAALRELRSTAWPRSLTSGPFPRVDRRHAAGGA